MPWRLVCTLCILSKTFFNLIHKSFYRCESKEYAFCNDSVLCFCRLLLLTWICLTNEVKWPNWKPIRMDGEILILMMSNRRDKIKNGFGKFGIRVVNIGKKSTFFLDAFVSLIFFSRNFLIYLRNPWSLGSHRFFSCGILTFGLHVSVFY